MTAPMDTRERLALSTEDVLREARDAKRWHDENGKPYTAGVIADCIATIERLAGVAQAAWQPLETAPLEPLRDPPLVMLWVDDGGHGGKGTHVFGRCYRSHDGTVRGVASGFSGNWPIRYWQPLPPGPSVSSTHQGGE